MIRLSAILTAALSQGPLLKTSRKIGFARPAVWARMISKRYHRARRGILKIEGANSIEEGVVRREKNIGNVD